VCRVRSPIPGRVSYVQFRFTQAEGGSGELELTVTYRVVPPRDILMMMMMMPKRSIRERRVVKSKNATPLRYVEDLSAGTS
jgi:hypothetical protein